MGPIEAPIAKLLSYLPNGMTEVMYILQTIGLGIQLIYTLRLAAVRQWFFSSLLMCGSSFEILVTVR